MIRVGEAPYLECSTKGDKRFSAFCAIVNGRSIEEQYQGAKRFEDGRTGLHWREAKGKRAINQVECMILYHLLWEKYLWENWSDLWPVLKSATGLSDVFGKDSGVCQASVLWEIRKFWMERGL